jgi:AraC-like DNA-binding protein
MTRPAKTPQAADWFKGPRTRIDDLLVLGCEHSRGAAEPMVEHRHNPERLEILYVAKGYRDYVVDGIPYTLEGNDVLIVPPNATHGSGGISQGKCTLYVVVVSLHATPGIFLCLRGAAADQLRNALRELREGAFPGRVEMRAALAEALAACQAPWDSLLAIARLGNAVTTFLLDVVQCAQEHRARSHTPQIQRLLDYIEANLDKPLRIRDMALAMKKSESYIKQRFTSEMGLSPVNHVLRRKVDLAKRRLIGSDVAVTEIALDLGFSTSQHFAKTFRQHVGVSPMAYRRSYRR